MKEDLLHQFWNPIWLKKNTFTGTQLETIRILNFGTLNPLQGPDFIGAEVEINGITYHGSVEIHIHTSNWDEHHHQLDPRYNQVVLHVVWLHDREVCNNFGYHIPTLCLEDHFCEKDLHKMQIMNDQKIRFPCLKLLNQVKPDIRNAQIQDAAITGFLEQSEECFQLAASINFDWERTLFIRLFAYCVDPQNRMNALNLARQLPLKVFRRYKASDYIGWILMDSGLWHSSPQKIQKQFEKFIKLYKQNVFPQISGIGAWHHRNLRPGSYPMERILQFLTWVDQRQGYWDALLLEQTFDLLDNSLKGPAWRELHRAKLIQNAILPIWGARRMFLGCFIDGELLNILESGTFELNRITSEIRILLPSQKNTQLLSFGLIHQSRHFCAQKRCSHCKIGQSLWNL